MASRSHGLWGRPRLDGGSWQEQEVAQRISIRSCDRCVHKPVCILYYGHGQIELRFGDTYSKDPEEFIGKLDERLASKCGFYLEGNASPEGGGIVEP